MTHDPIADLLTRIRNGYLARLATIEAPYSKIKAEIFRTDLNGTIQFYFDSKFNLLHRFL